VSGAAASSRQYSASVAWAGNEDLEEEKEET
jgi:hypothetical protein